MSAATLSRCVCFACHAWCCAVAAGLALDMFVASGAVCVLRPRAVGLETYGWGLRAAAATCVRGCCCTSCRAMCRHFSPCPPSPCCYACFPWTGRRNLLAVSAQECWADAGSPAAAGTSELQIRHTVESDVQLFGTLQQNSSVHVVDGGCGAHTCVRKTTPT